MYVERCKFDHHWAIHFESKGDADEYCELLKELLNAKKSCQGAILCTRPPKEKPIDEHVTS